MENKKGLKIKGYRINIENVFSYSHNINVYKEYVLTIDSIDENNTLDIIFKKNEKTEFEKILKTLDNIFKIN